MNPSDARTFLIGDLQGCFASLQTLLHRLDFRAGQDHVWLLGDLINRGPDSLACLRWAATTPGVNSVLGNHDFHLLSVVAGNRQYLSKKDTLDDILSAPDRDSLLHWLRQRPLVAHLPQHRALLVHAGIPPQWTWQEALLRAAEVENTLQGTDWQTFVADQLFGDSPDGWQDELSGWARLRYITNALVRMRLCHADGRLELKTKNRSDSHHNGLAPWFSWRTPTSDSPHIYFGHWSVLGHHISASATCLDGGCLWGRQLLALQLENQQLTRIDCPQYAQPGKEG